MLKKITLIMTIVFLICTIQLNFVYCAEKNHMDTIILLDTSGSMRASDKNRIAIEAVKMYVDMMETSGSRIGILTFSSEVTNTLPLKVINTQKDKEEIKNQIERLVYEGYTDIGMSLKNGVVNLSEALDEAHSPAVILFTDGRIEMDETNPSSRTAEESQNDVIEALEIASGKFPIYTIGLNHNQNVDEQFLIDISQRTGASNYITDSAKNLPQIFNEIFAKHIKSTLIDTGAFISDGDSYYDVEINIPNTLVVEANIIMLSQNEIIDAKLLDPDLNERQIDDNLISYAKSKNYSMIKIINPTKGRWILKVKGSKNDTVQVNLIYNYTIGLKMTVEENGGDLLIAGKLTTGDQEINDSEVYKGLTAQLVLENADLSTQEFPLTVNDTEIVGQLDENTINKIISDAKIYIRASNSEYSRESEKYEIKAPVTIIPTEETPTPATSDPTPQASAVLATSNPTPQASVAPAPTDTEASDGFNILPIFLLVLAIFLIFIFGVLVFYAKQNAKKTMFSGSIEVHVVDSNNMYIAIENPSLHTFIGRISLFEFLSAGEDIYFAAKIENFKEILAEIKIRQVFYSNQPALIVQNTKKFMIFNDLGQAKKQTTFFWKNNEQIIIKYSENDLSKIELIYHADDFC